MSDDNPNAPLLCDNRSAVINIKKDSLYEINARSRHIAVRYSQVRDHASRLVFCPTKLMLADGLTKGISNGKIYRQIFFPQEVSKLEDPEIDCSFAAISF